VVKQVAEFIYLGSKMNQKGEIKRKRKNNSTFLQIINGKLRNRDILKQCKTETHIVYFKMTLTYNTINGPLQRETKAKARI
jgi:hypothetical protein